MTAATPARDDRALPSGHKVDVAAVNCACLRPRRHRNLPVLPPSPMPVSPFPMPPPLRPKVLAPLQCPQISPRRIANEHDVASMTAVAAVRAAARNARLAPKAPAAVSASTALNPDFRLVIHQQPSLEVELPGGWPGGVGAPLRTLNIEP